MEIGKKLQILADSAKYDASCSSSGSKAKRPGSQMGSLESAGCCHSFSADGRCVSLLKILMTNYCMYDCQYCINRKSNDIPRATFTPREIADLAMDFYRRNYIEGLFLSSAIIKDANYTTELLIQALNILRKEYRFGGYIHVKAIPGADPRLIDQLGYLADRLSSNIELPSRESLEILAPDKKPEALVLPMKQIKYRKDEFALTPKNRLYAPAGQSTQMIIGATPDTDFKILKTSANLYQKYDLKRVFFSAYIPVVESTLLPAITSQPPLLREHRLYQADWMMRFYQFEADEILNEQNPYFNLYLDPKANWALQNMDYFPMDIETASYKMLLRVPGIGPTSAKRIVSVRKYTRLGFDDLGKLGVVLKRAQYFLLCKGKPRDTLIKDPQWIMNSLISAEQYKQMKKLNTQTNDVQLTLFDVEQFESVKKKEGGY